MLKWIKRKWMRYQDRQGIKNAFQILRYAYLHLDPGPAYELKKEFITLLDEYYFNWGEEDGFVRFYWQELYQLTTIKYP